MALDKLNKNMQIISALSDEPNDVDGLTSAQLKAKFDEAGEAIKAYINNVLLPALEESVGAGNIGATPFEGITGTTVQEQLAQVLAKAVKLPETATFKYLNVYPGLFDIAHLDDFWNRFITRLDEQGIMLGYYAGETVSAPKQIVHASGGMWNGDPDGVIVASIDIGTTEENTDPNKTFNITARPVSAESDGIPRVMIRGLIRCAKDPADSLDLTNKGYVDAAMKEAKKLPPSAIFTSVTAKNADSESPSIAQLAAGMSPGVISVMKAGGAVRYAMLSAGISEDGSTAGGSLTLATEENGEVTSFYLSPGRPSTNGGKLFAFVSAALRYTASVEVTNDRDLVHKKYVDDAVKDAVLPTDPTFTSVTVPYSDGNTEGYNTILNNHGLQIRNGSSTGRAISIYPSGIVIYCGSGELSIENGDDDHAPSITWYNFLRGDQWTFDLSEWSGEEDKKILSIWQNFGEPASIRFSGAVVENDEDLVVKKYVDDAITTKIGSIDTILDSINGEVI